MMGFFGADMREESTCLCDSIREEGKNTHRYNCLENYATYSCIVAIVLLPPAL